MALLLSRSEEEDATVGLVEPSEADAMSFASPRTVVVAAEPGGERSPSSKERLVVFAGRVGSVLALASAMGLVLLACGVFLGSGTQGRAAFLAEPSGATSLAGTTEVDCGGMTCSLNLTAGDECKFDSSGWVCHHYGAGAKTEKHAAGIIASSGSSSAGPGADGTASHHGGGGGSDPHGGTSPIAPFCCWDPSYRNDPCSCPDRHNGALETQKPHTGDPNNKDYCRGSGTWCPGTETHVDG